MLAIWANRVSIALSWVGIFIAGVLTYGHFSRFVPPCSVADHGCAIVQQSKQSMFMGVPVALMGLLAYVVILLLAVMRTRTPDQWRTSAMRGLLITGLGTGFSAYLTWVAATEIGVMCQWCLGSLATMTGLFLTHGVLVQAGEPAATDKRGDWMTLGIAALVAMGLIGTTIVQMKSMSSILAGDVKFDGLDNAKIIGRPEKVQGNADAKLTLVEFADFNCPACRGAAETVQKVFNQNGGRLKWAYRHMPLSNLQGHESSMYAARLSEIAADQGKFWKFAEIILDKGNTERTKSESGLMAMAEQAGVDITEASKRMKNPMDKNNDDVATDMDIAINKMHINTTPTFVLIAEGYPPKAIGGDQLEATLKTEPYASLLKQ
ncbi:MAG: vitamin K epoxide reductase family protein [Armatimonadetes bacterium]|nr:vitamin K epoxide reductase family protein [Armatimonadota bacterium]